MQSLHVAVRVYFRHGFFFVPANRVFIHYWFLLNKLCILHGRVLQMDFQDVAFLPSQASFYTSFLN